MSEFDITTDGADIEGPTPKARVKAAASQATQALRQEAQTFAAAAQTRAKEEAQTRQQMGAKALGDFAGAIRKAGEELSQSDQSPAARLVGQAADGLENLSRNLADTSPEEVVGAVRDFGRRHPAAFIGGAVLVGVALGRFLRASDAAADATDLDDLGEPVLGSSYSPGPPATADQALGLVDVEGLEYGDLDAAAGLDTPLADDLGDLSPSDIDDTAAGPSADPDRKGV